MTSPPVLANDFAAQWQETRADALAAIDRVGQSGWLILGEEVQQFELDLAKWWGISHAVGVASGLDALEIALRCVGVGRGDRVLTTPLTAFATTLAILRIGAEPAWVDVDATGGLDLEAAQRALDSDPTIRALLPVHLYGHPLDPDALAALTERSGIAVVEDCAQSAGARRAGCPTGRAGRVAATSFYPTKNLGTYGDGGALLTDDETIAKRARVLRNYGQDKRFHHVEIGLNSRLDELQAAILRSALLPRLDRWLARRAVIADRYTDALRDSFLSPIRPADGRSANHLFPVEVKNGSPARILEQLTTAGVAVGRHYPLLCPEQPSCSGIGRRLGDFPTAAALAKREISLPLHPHLDDEEVDLVIHHCLSLAPRSNE